MNKHKHIIVTPEESRCEDCGAEWNEPHMITCPTLSEGIDRLYDIEEEDSDSYWRDTTDG